MCKLSVSVSECTQRPFVFITKHVLIHHESEARDLAAAKALDTQIVMELVYENNHGTRVTFDYEWLLIRYGQQIKQLSIRRSSRIE